MNRSRTFLVAATLAAVLANESRADFIVYDLGALGKAMTQVAAAGRSLDQKGNDTNITLPGKVVVNPGGTVSYTHPNGAQVHFKIDEVKIKRAPTTREEFNKLFGQAGKDPEELMKVSVWALKKALLPDFYKVIDRVLEINPDHEAAKRIRELKKQMKEPLPVDPATEKYLRSVVNRPKMKIATSNHFILLHDTPPKQKGQKMSRADRRLELLEKVYESFLLLFHAQDVELDIPRERMMVVLFNEEPDFREYATGLHPSLASAGGFWEQIRNVSYFYDHSTTEQFKLIETLMDELRKEKDDARRWRDPETIRYVKVLELLMEVERENSDITVVSHECTHQMAGNTGLLPRHVEIPSWVHEGLATYFEAPSAATWAGIGAVSIERLIFYRGLAEHDRVHSNIDFIVGDQIFDYSGGHIGNILHGYAQAWALTHFLIENHLKEFVAFYRILGEMPPDVALTPELLTSLFSRVFGSDHKTLDQEWRSYMRTLKTDLERLEESEKKTR